MADNKVPDDSAAKIAGLEAENAALKAKNKAAAVPSTTEELSSTVAWIATFLLIVLMVLTFVMPDGIARWVAFALPILVIVYLGVQNWATVEREPNSRGKFILDNLLAFIGILSGLGFIILLLILRDSYTLDHWWIIVVCTMVGFSDLGFGVYIFQRIGAAIKDRR